jgi:hypothetical protein
MVFSMARVQPWQETQLSASVSRQATSIPAGTAILREESVKRRVDQCAACAVDTTLTKLIEERCSSLDLGAVPSPRVHLFCIQVGTAASLLAA